MKLVRALLHVSMQKGQYTVNVNGQGRTGIKISMPVGHVFDECFGDGTVTACLRYASGTPHARLASLIQSTLVPNVNVFTKSVI